MQKIRAIEATIVSALREATTQALDVPPPRELQLELPKNESFGDYSASFALRLAKVAKQPPRKLAESILKALQSSSPKGWSDVVSEASIAGAGYLNFKLTQAALSDVVREIVHDDQAFGRGEPLKDQRVLLEYVSANPTGPLTVAHGRQAALGDALKNILSHAGCDVKCEYYNNDEGVQIQMLGQSLYARVLEARGQTIPFPENGYQGDYLIELAKDFSVKHKQVPELTNQGEDLKKFSDFAKKAISSSIKKDLDDFGVQFDVWYSQAKLGDSGQVEETLKDLDKKGVTYTNEGAVWLRSTDFGDDKDRVLIKSDKTYTYLTPDIAYHRDKFKRGFTCLIDILGPDHHGYIGRLKASQAALGHDPDKVQVKIAQLVTLYKGKEVMRMSTRKGEFITLRQVLDEVGRDAARFFFCMRKFDTHLDFDLELAKKQASDNPVFYIQYVYARIASIHAQARERNITLNPKQAKLNLLVEAAELSLMRNMRKFPRVIAQAAQHLEPSILIEYLTSLATSFHRFYENCTVLNENAELTQSRLLLISALKRVIRLGLSLLGVSAPEKM